jgi:hypothetical protein
VELNVTDEQVLHNRGSTSSNCINFKREAIRERGGETARHVRVCMAVFQLLATRGEKVPMSSYYELDCCYKELC